MRPLQLSCSSFFFFNDTATTEIYTLSLHDALPIYLGRVSPQAAGGGRGVDRDDPVGALGSPQRHHHAGRRLVVRSEEHTSELQSRQYLVCRLLLEKKKKIDQESYTLLRTTN